MNKSNLLMDDWDLYLRVHDSMEKYRAPALARSYPILGFEADVVVLKYFFYRAEQVNHNAFILFPPREVIVFDSTTMHIRAQYKAQDVFGHIAPFEPYDWVVDMREYDQRKAQVGQLRALYDVLMSRYPHTPADDACRQFGDLLQAISPPVVLPYYEALSPHFWTWLG